MSDTVTVDQDFAVNYGDIREGAIFNFGDGHFLEVQPHSQRIYLEVWGNGYMEVLLYEHPQPDTDDSDRIQLLVTDFDFGAIGRKGFLMNAQDAIAMVRGLSAGIQRAIEAGIPLKPEGK